MDDFTNLGALGIMPITITITEFIMRFTPENFDKKRFAPLVNLAAAIIASVLWQVYMPDTNMVHAIIRGVWLGLGGSGLWDLYKSGKANISSIRGRGDK